RAAPVERKSERQPAGLRAELFLAHIMRPSASGLSYAAAHHQKLNDAAIAHVHVIPVIEPRPEDHHGAALGNLRIGRELARYLDDGLSRNTRHFLRPGGGEGDIFVEALGYIVAPETAVETVTGAVQVEHGRNTDPASIGTFNEAHRD